MRIHFFANTRRPLPDAFVICYRYADLTTTPETRQDMFTKLAIFAICMKKPGTRSALRPNAGDVNN
jgi:hypothetical protein